MSLFHFVKDKLPQGTDPEKYAANLLYAATRYHQLEVEKEMRARVRDDQFIPDRLAEIGPKQLSGAVRAELVKLHKLIVAELESRAPHRRSPSTAQEAPSSPKRSGPRPKNDEVLDFEAAERAKDPTLTDKELLVRFKKKCPGHSIFEAEDPENALRAARSRRKGRGRSS
jgi:hypothetical protein